MADAGFRLTVEGEREFKEALTNINEELKANRAELELLTEQYDLNDGGVDNLTEQHKLLGDSLEKQGEKVDLLRGKYDAMVDAYGKQDTKVQSMRTQLAKAETAYTKLEKEVRKSEDALEDATKDIERMNDELDDVPDAAGDSVDGLKKMSGTDVMGGLSDLTDMLGIQLPGGLDNLVQGLDDATAGFGSMATVLGAGGAVVGAVKGTVDLIKGAAEHASDLKDTAAELGLTVEEYQKLEYAMQSVGFETDDLSEIFAALYGKIKDTHEITGEYVNDSYKLNTASDETKEAVAEARAEWESLGVQIYDNDGKLRSVKDIFEDLVTSFNNSQEPTETLITMQGLLGDSAFKLNPLLGITGDEIKRIGDEAERSGKIMSEDMVEALDEVATKMANVESGWEKAKTGFAASLWGLITGDMETSSAGSEYMWNAIGDLLNVGGIETAPTVSEAEKAVGSSNTTTTSNPTVEVTIPVKLNGKLVGQTVSEVQWSESRAQIRNAGEW